MSKNLFKTLIINALRLKQRIITSEAALIKQKNFRKVKQLSESFEQIEK
jgi:hypothetical protein